MRIDWQGIAHKHGYQNDRLMLADLYGLQHMSALTISEKLGISTTAVFRRLREHGIRVRPANCNKRKWKQGFRVFFAKEGGQRD